MLVVTLSELDAISWNVHTSVAIFATGCIVPLVVRLLLTWSSFTLLTASIGIISTRRHPTRRREQREAGARAACDPHELPRDRRPERGDVGSVESYELLS